MPMQQFGAVLGYVHRAWWWDSSARIEEPHHGVLAGCWGLLGGCWLRRDDVCACLGLVAASRGGGILGGDRADCAIDPGPITASAGHDPCTQCIRHCGQER